MTDPDTNQPEPTNDDIEFNLDTADSEDQKEFMRTWFFEHFEDPAENCPHSTADGGYFYLWGGPYDAGEELQEEFGGTIPDDVIQELVDDLSGECSEWSAKPGAEDYEQYVADIAVSTSEQLANCEDGLLSAERLAAVGVPQDLQHKQLQMVFVQVITILETFLSDTFIHAAMLDEARIRRLLETDTTFKEEKVPLRELFSTYAGIRGVVKSHLTKIVWHNLAKVSCLYKDVLDIKFGKHPELFRAITVRHDCVHRAGKSEDDKLVVITRGMVDDLIVEVRLLVRDIDRQLNRRT